MTPQPRHLDLARDIIDKYHDFRHPLQVEDMARALAEAENSAAWRVWDECEKTLREFVADHNEMVYGCRDLADGSLSIVPAEYMLEYGPRPTKENQP